MESRGTSLLKLLKPPYLAYFIGCLGITFLYITGYTGSMRMIDNDEVGLQKVRRFIIALFGTAHLGMHRVVTP